ncbi:hypothetical protein ANCDUO_24657 [Ancylostoma duodenale]|uniref:ABC transmembrane type-1 domain-containing protein n=1 Tax=Ancylostoma duodenale TaxID=51022 RepID=A0A0C2FKB2_9BILA|nr:hypothetical protein ANCDUO_24657 [Ancylostoma duodenale]
MAVIIFSSVGVGIMIFQLLSSVFFAIVSENLAMRFRVQSFKNLLFQDASYFDNPAHTPGKLITRLATDAPNIKAVTLLGIGLLFLLATSMIWLARTIMNKNIELIKNDEAGRVSSTVSVS